MPSSIGVGVVAAANSRRERFLKVKSLSQESALSSASSRGSDTSPGQKIIVGGSYSASNAASGGGRGFPPERPRLADVAQELMRAAADGTLPSALRSSFPDDEEQLAKEKQERLRQQQQLEQQQQQQQKMKMTAPSLKRGDLARQQSSRLDNLLPELIIPITF